MEKAKPVAWVIVFQCWILLSSGDSNLSLHAELYTKLLSNYTRTIPVRNFLDTVTVGTRFRLNQILSLDGKQEVLSYTGELTLQWSDEFLHWNTSQYPGIWGVTLPIEKLWMPDVNVGNRFDINSATDVRKINWVQNMMAIVFPTGRVVFIIKSDFHTTCSLDMTQFPFDSQTCYLDICLQMYPQISVNLTTGDRHEIMLEKFSTNGEWDILATSAECVEYELEAIPTPFSLVRFTMHLKRKPFYYIINILLPCMMLSMLTLLVFCMPPDAGEKVSLSITVLLSFTVFMLMVSDFMPQTSSHTPVLAIYLLAVMATSMFSLYATVLVLSLHHRDFTDPIPDWVNRILGCSSRREDDTASKEKMNKDDDTSASNNLSSSEIEILKMSESGEIPRVAGIQVALLYNMWKEIASARARRENEGHVAQGPNWKTVAKRLDRLFLYLFLVVHIVVNVCVLNRL